MFCLGSRGADLWGNDKMLWPMHAFVLQKVLWVLNNRNTRHHGSYAAVFSFGKIPFCLEILIRMPWKNSFIHDCAECQE